MLQQATSHSLLPTVGVGKLQIHSLQFADDLLLFFDGTAKSAKVIKFLLDAFSAASGLKINFAKSSIIPVNMETSSATGLADFFGYAAGSFPLTYMGLPISPKALRKADDLPLIEKVDKRLAGWKGSLLSRAGRLVLLNSVLSSVPVFFFSTFRIPVWVSKAIDKIRRGFFWKGKVLDDGFNCLVNWEQVCRPRDNGGLGINNLKVMNSGLLMKNLWSFYNARNLPWVRLLLLLHYKRRPPSAGGSIPIKCSPLWKGTLSISVPFHTSVYFSIEDGSLAPFWHVHSDEEDLLRNHFPALFAASTHKHLVVNKWLQRFGMLQNLGFRFISPEGSRELPRLCTLVTGLSLSSSPNAISWRWCSKGRFSVQSAYRFLAFDGGDDRRVGHLWSIRVPLKVKVFLWLGARNKILTADLLSRRGWVGPSMCPLCGRDTERLEHLFFDCPYAREVWGWTLHGESQLLLELLTNPGDLASRWSRASSSLKGNRKLLLDLSIAGIC